MAEPNEGSATAALEEARDNVDESTRDKAGNTYQHADYSFEAMKKVEVEKVFVLSFRTLQLKRIAEMQDELLHLTFGSASQQTPNKEEVDAVLSNYARALRNYETLSQNAPPSIPNDAKFLGLLAAVNHTVSSSRYDSYGRLVNLLSALCNNLYQSYRRLISREPYISWNAVEMSFLPSNVIKMLETGTGRLGFRELDQKGREERSQKNALTRASSQPHSAEQHSSDPCRS